jgi:hypothetical protein
MVVVLVLMFIGGGRRAFSVWALEPPVQESVVVVADDTRIQPTALRVQSP